MPGGAGSRCLELPRQFSPFQWITTNPGYCVNPSILSARLSIRILNKKRQNWRHGGPESRCSKLPRRFSPFQWITTNPGYCVNLYRLPPCWSELNKRRNWRHGRPESRCSEPPWQFSPFQRITMNPGYCMNRLYRLPSCISEFWI